jgi:hypothetical protein
MREILIFLPEWGSPVNVVGDALLNTNNGQKVKKSVALIKEDACSMNCVKFQIIF